MFVSLLSSISNYGADGGRTPMMLYINVHHSLRLVIAKHYRTVVYGWKKNIVGQAL